MGIRIVGLGGLEGRDIIIDHPLGEGTGIGDHPHHHPRITGISLIDRYIVVFRTLPQVMF